MSDDSSRSGLPSQWDSWSMDKDSVDDADATQTWVAEDSTQRFILDDEGLSLSPMTPSSVVPGQGSSTSPVSPHSADITTPYSPSRALPPAAELKDRVISDRYRLEDLLAERFGTMTWRAFDSKLSRPVVVHVLSEHDKRAQAVMEAARNAAVATDSRFLRVLDAVASEDHGTFVVCEYVPGLSLEKVLRSGPLSALEAAWVIREAADALVALHAKGLFHQRLTPDTLVITTTGNVKIVGFLTEAALHPESIDDEFDATDPNNSWSEQERGDVSALGRLLFASLVSRWPTRGDTNELGLNSQSLWGLQPAPKDDRGWLTPRQVRAGVSPALDVLCDQLLNDPPRSGQPAITTASQLDQALTRVLGTADASADLEHRVRYPVTSPPITGSNDAVEETTTGTALSTPVPPPANRGPANRTQSSADEARSKKVTTTKPAKVPNKKRTTAAGGSRPPEQRRWLRILLFMIALTLVGSLIAVAINQSDKKAATPPPSPSTTAPKSAYPISKVDDFDPKGDGGSDDENPNTIAQAWDKNPKTAWTTETYLRQATLGGLKPGVGLVVDLGQAVEVSRVELTLQGSPTAVQLMVPKGDAAKVTAAPMKSQNEWTIVDSNAQAGEKLTLSAKGKTVTTRYVLIYLTSLPSVGNNRYRGAIAEIEVFG